MVKLIDKHETNDAYSAVYDCGNKTLKVVRIGEGVFSTSPARNTSQLEIQKVGLEFSIEALDFDLGRVETHISSSLHGSSMFPFVYQYPDKADKLLQRFGREFKEVFEFDEKLRLCMPTRFKDLINYFK